MYKEGDRYEMDKIEAVQKIKEIGVVAVIRGNSAEEAVTMADACIKGGVTAIELCLYNAESAQSD